MSHPDLITTSVWDAPGNIEKLTKLYFEGLSYSQIAAAMGEGISREACLGKVKRLNLPARDLSDRRPDRVTRSTTPLITGRAGRSGNPGVPSVLSIKHRAEGRAHIKPPREIVDEGVDVTSLIAFAARRIGHECAWIPGDPADGAMCCGKPVVEGHQWCPEHYARVYNSRVQG